MKAETINKINKGELDGESTLDFALSHAENVKEEILQSWFKKGASRNDKALNEFLLIEIVRSILGAEPRCFFILLNVSRRLRALLDLKYVDDLERYKYFKRKIKNLKGRLREISKRSLGTEGDESFVFDSSIVTADLNGYRNGKKIKKGEYGARFTYSTTKGTVIGFQTLLLFNLEKFSVRKFEIYPIDASTKRMWKEMVCDEIGTKGGKKKTVIADGGFFAYENYIQSANHRIESIINPRCDCRENLKEKLENMSPRLELFEIHDPEKKEKVMSEMRDLVSSIIEKSLNYDEYKERRSTIEKIFKIAKQIYGVKNLHVYHKEGAYWKIFIGFYFSCLLYQNLNDEKINVDRAVGLFGDNTDVW